MTYVCIRRIINLRHIYKETSQLIFFSLTRRKSNSFVYVFLANCQVFEITMSECALQSSKLTFFIIWAIPFKAPLFKISFNVPWINLADSERTETLQKIGCFWNGDNYRKNDSWNLLLAFKSIWFLLHELLIDKIHAYIHSWSTKRFPYNWSILT